MDNEPWIQTYTGKKFTPLNPREEDIDILDIAHALSNLCRFTGHSSEFISIAQHSVFVSSLVPNKHKLCALLHDASEAYLNDISTPLKKSKVFETYRKIEENLMSMIYNKYGVSEHNPLEVKQADSIALSTEAKNFLNLRPDWVLKDKPLDIKISSLNPTDAKKLFLETFNKYYL